MQRLGLPTAAALVVATVLALCRPSHAAPPAKHNASPAAPSASPAASPTNAAELAAAIREAVIATKTDGLKGIPPGAATFELRIDAQGQLVAVRLARKGPTNPFDDAARALLFSAEPFAAPAASLAGPGEELECLVRLGVAPSKAGPSLDVAAGCFSADAVVAAVTGLSAEARGAADAGAQLLLGYSLEAQGDAQTAGQTTAAYRAAVRDAPQWGLAARALGLNLVKEKRVNDGITQLKIYVESRRPPADAAQYARELSRYQKYLEEKAAAAKRPRPPLDKRDLAQGIYKGYALLESCLGPARAAGRLAVGNDTVVLSWKVVNDGSVTQVSVDGPKSLAMTDHAECIERAVRTWRFPPFTSGSEVLAKNVPIKVKGVTPKVPAQGVAGGADSGAADHEADAPSFASCARSENEVGAYIRGHFAEITKCFSAERKRLPTVQLPDRVPIGFVIDVDGSIRGIAAEHRHFREGPVAACLTQALAGNLAPSDGADCPASFFVDLRGL